MTNSKMLLSVSRRTDIPAFYADWCFNRLKEGFVCVRNPMNRRQVSKIMLSPDNIDCIVFWSKNPKPMLNRLDLLRDYCYYFQFTITPYDTDIEMNLPDKKEIIDTFKSLSDLIGPQRVVWRYDPILLSDDIDIAYHLHHFEAIAQALSTYTDTCVISFMDSYDKTRRNLKNTTVRSLSVDEMMCLSKGLVAIATHYGMELQTCAEEIDLDNIGILHGSCIDKNLIEKLSGKKLKVSKDKYQRKACGCVQSVDIGAYNTCPHHCLYCYANANNNLVSRNRTLHDPHSPLLIGNIEPFDVVKRREK